MSVSSDSQQRGWDFEAAAMPFVDPLYNTAFRMTRNAEASPLVHRLVEHGDVEL